MKLYKIVYYNYIKNYTYIPQGYIGGGPGWFLTGEATSTDICTCTQVGSVAFFALSCTVIEPPCFSSLASSPWDRSMDNRVRVRVSMLPPWPSELRLLDVDPVPPISSQGSPYL